MPVRVRTMSTTAGVGHYLKKVPWGTLEGDVAIPATKARCEDVVDGTRSDHPLLIEKTTQIGNTFSSPLEEWGNGGYATHYASHVPANFQVGTFPHLILPERNDDMDATRAFADTNPSRPTVDSIAFAAELRQLPALFKMAGDHMLKKGANTFLSYQYGWRPLIKDLVEMCFFMSNVAKREQELRNLHSKGGLKRRLQISSETTTAVQHEVVESFMYFLSGDCLIKTTRNRWATARWVPDTGTGMIPTTDAEYRKLAIRAVYGLNFDIESAWQLIPWSWLIDWGASVGDFLGSQRNLVGATCSGVNLMTHTRTDRVYSNWSCLSSFSNWTMGNTHIISETKRRSAFTNPSVSATIPFISGTQLSILGALGIQRLRGIR